MKPILLICSLAAMVVCFAFFFRRRPSRAKFMYTEAILHDENGNEFARVRSGPLEIPAPDRVKRQGLSQVKAYVTRLFASTAQHATLLVGTPDEQRGLGIIRREGKTEFSLLAKGGQEPADEQTIRAFFDRHHLEPSEDYLAGEDRVLSYVVPGDAQQVTDVCTQLLTEIYSVRENEGLQFLYREHSI